MNAARKPKPELAKIPFYKARMDYEDSLRAYIERVIALQAAVTIAVRSGQMSAPLSNALVKANTEVDAASFEPMS